MAAYIIPVAIYQFRTLIRPVCRLLGTADQRAYFFALRQQMLGRCAAYFSRDSHY